MPRRRSPWIDSPAAAARAPVDGQIVLNHKDNEFNLFTRVLSKASCGGRKIPAACMGGCPAEEIVMGAASCASEPDIVPVCRLWKADISTASSPVSC